MGTDGHKRITIETERILIVAQGPAARGRCENCGHEADDHTANTAETLFASSEQIGIRKQEKSRFVRSKNKLGSYLKSLLRLGAGQDR